MAMKAKELGEAHLAFILIRRKKEKIIVSADSSVKTNGKIRKRTDFECIPTTT